MITSTFREASLLGRLPVSYMRRGDIAEMIDAKLVGERLDGVD
jgi:hypothetical protein